MAELDRQFDELQTSVVRGSARGGRSSILRNQHRVRSAILNAGFPMNDRRATGVYPDERVQERIEIMQGNPDLFQIVLCGATRTPTWMSRTIVCGPHSYGHQSEQHQQRYEDEPSAHETPLLRLDVTALWCVDRLRGSGDVVKYCVSANIYLAGVSSSRMLRQMSR
jgi:hypothetical protein